jgi:hypothetical protein
MQPKTWMIACCFPDGFFTSCSSASTMMQHVSKQYKVSNHKLHGPRFGNDSCDIKKFHRFVWNKHKCHSYMCIVWTSMLCAHHLNTNVICIFVLVKHRCMSICVVYTWKLCTQLSCLNNAWHLCLNNTNLWNNKFCMDLKQTHKAYNVVMTWQSRLPHHGECSPNTKKIIDSLNYSSINYIPCTILVKCYGYIKMSKH